MRMKLAQYLLMGAGLCLASCVTQTTSTVAQDAKVEAAPEKKEGQSADQAALTDISTFSGVDRPGMVRPALHNEISEDRAPSSLPGDYRNGLRSPDLPDMLPVNLDGSIISPTQ